MKIMFDQEELHHNHKMFMVKDIAWGLVLIANIAFVLGVVLYSL